MNPKKYAILIIGLLLLIPYYLHVQNKNELICENYFNVECDGYSLFEKTCSCEDGDHILNSKMLGSRSH